MKRRPRVIVTASAAAVIVASLVLARILSVASDRDGLLAVAQAALFVLFAVAALTLFAAVVMDFDRWVETVRPVPKRLMRRWIGRVARRITRVIVWVLVLCGAVMSWLWSTVGAALGWVLAGSGAGLAWLWAWVVRAGAWSLVVYRAGVGWLWTSAGRALAWALGRSGVALTLLWMWSVRPGARLLVLYRTALHWLWTSTGRALAWTLGRSGVGLTLLWAWLVRAGIRLLVLYRTTLRWLWSTVGRALTLLLAAAGAVLTWLWSRLARVGAWMLARCGAGIRRLWWAAVGRGDEAKAKPLRRMYASAIDSAFGIPPEGISLDTVGPRRARRPAPANRPRPQRPSFRDEAVDSRRAMRTTLESALSRDPRARYVGRQVTRRGERRKSEELLAAVLARFRSVVGQSREGDEREDPR